ncbi:VOC family protein [Aeromonas dhakensis]|uniref:VOC family protein n=1 Tax=Aeromonas dhakensis TaxID=196024 RepID=UPI0005A5E151|nr:VOC family protein [Aeromonas dhakensis]
MAEQDIACEHALAEGTTFTWHELYLPDAEAGIRFYTEVLGWESQTMAMEGGDYPMLVANGRPIAGVQSTRGNPEMAGVPPHWATYIAVDDVDARVLRVNQHGGSVVVPAMNIPGVGRMALIADPQGAHIWLFTPDPM